MNTRGWGCKRLPTRYNGDWPLLFVDGEVQLVQAQEAGADAPADWKRRKKAKLLHFTFGTAKPWDWWAYPFLPYVDLWLEVFHRVESPEEGRRLDKKDSAGRWIHERPRWKGVAGQVLWGLAPLAVAMVIWRMAKRWNIQIRMLRRTAIMVARYAVPLKVINPRSLFGNVFNLLIGLVLALSAAVLAFNAVPAKQLGVSRPEAAWAYFLARATALVVLFEGCYLVLVSLKAHQVVVPVPVETGAPYASISPLTSIEDDGSTALSPSPRNGGLRREASEGAGDAAEVLGKKGGGSVGGLFGARQLALRETLAHLVVLSAMAASLVSAPLWGGLNGAPASREIIPGLAHLATLLVAFTFSAVRLPPLWAAHARAWDSNYRGRRRSKSDWREVEAGRAALGNLSPLSDHHNA